VRLLVVRHAKAGVRGTWPGSDLDRPLSDRGREQTAALTPWLLAAEPTAVISSSAVRCVDTVRPAADDLGLEVATAPELLEGAQPEDSLDLLVAQTDGPVIVCSHGDVIGRVIGLLAQRGVPLDGELRWPKASVWELTVDDGVVTHGRLHLPPSL